MFGRLRVRVIWIAAFAAFLHALLPAVHQLAAQEHLQLVCSVGGQLTLLATGSAAAAASGSRDDGNSLQPPDCPLCLAGSHLAGTPPRHGPAFTRPELSFDDPTRHAPSVLESRRVLAFLSRAPPATS